MDKNIQQAYDLAKAKYAEIGIDTDKAIKALEGISLSLHCWQADDVIGFENPDGQLSGGIQATGNYPGKARTIAELRADVEKALTLIPGKHRLNIHAIYADFSKGKADRDKIDVTHFQSWIDWGKAHGIALDFNCTCFSHPMAASGFTLASLDEKIRKFWVDHVIACRKIAAEMGKAQGTPCIHNIWIPDGSKDVTVNRYAHRAQLKKSLDEIFAVEIDPKYMKDCVECKLFGIGSETYVVGSHEFYMAYGMKNNRMITLDMGHFHPTELVSDKISSILLFSDELMFHVSRGLRWDSDHVVTLTDELQNFAAEIVRMDALKRVNIGLDFFDASINRIGAYVVGSRSTQKAFMMALLEPVSTIRKYENAGAGFETLALMEEGKNMPWGAVWDYFCEKNGTPAGAGYIPVIQTYEKEVLSKR